MQHLWFTHSYCTSPSQSTVQYIRFDLIWYSTQHLNMEKMHSLTHSFPWTYDCVATFFSRCFGGRRGANEREKQKAKSNLIHWLWESFLYACNYVCDRGEAAALHQSINQRRLIMARHYYSTLLTALFFWGTAFHVLCCHNLQPSGDGATVLYQGARQISIFLLITVTTIFWIWFGILSVLQCLPYIWVL